MRVEREKERKRPLFFLFFRHFFSHPWLLLLSQTKTLFALFSPPQLPAAISKNPQYSDLKQLVDKAGLASALGPDFSGTLFAPVSSFYSFFFLEEREEVDERRREKLTSSSLPPNHQTSPQTNAAFDNLAKAGGPSFSSLLNGPTNDLKKILLFHVR